MTDTYLQNIRNAESDLCWESISWAQMGTHHVLFYCSALTGERREMHEMCAKNGGGNPGKVRQLICSRMASPKLLDFIAATQVGKRARRQEQEINKYERERDKAWGLDKGRMEGDKEGEAEGEREDNERELER